MSSSNEDSEKRNRGRPKKTQVLEEQPRVPQDQTLKRKAGRPPKVPKENLPGEIVPEQDVAIEPQLEAKTSKRSRKPNTRFPSDY
jgi:hypothetical protein